MSTQALLADLPLADQLWEIEQVKQLKARYFRFVDTREWDAVTALFAPDCDMRSAVFPEVQRPQQFFAHVASMITPGVSVHHGHMPEITLTSPTTATGIWAMFDRVDTDLGAVGFVGYGHYHETYRKYPDVGWLITSFELRRLRLDHTVPRPSERASDSAGANPSEVGPRLARLEAEREILRTLHSYGHAIDYGRESVYADCFTADAILHWAGAEPERMVGVEAIVKAFRLHTHAPDRYHKHFLAEPLIEIEGTRAHVESMFVRFDQYDTIPKICAFGRYVDDLIACPDGRWRFFRRTAEIEAWRHGSPPLPSVELEETE